MDGKLIAAGAIVGLLLGLTGMGGGALMTPILMMLGLPTTKAIGSDLLFAALSKGLSGVQHARYGQVDWWLVRWLATGSVPGAFAGAVAVSYISSTFPASGGMVKGLVAVLVIVSGLALLIRPPAKERTGSDRSKRLAVLLGGVLGLLVGFTSVGSGTLFAVALSLIFALAPRKLVGTDVVHGALLVCAAAAAHAAAGNVEFGSVSWLLVGSVPGTLVGGRMSRWLPARGLRPLIAATMLASGLLLIVKL